MTTKTRDLRGDRRRKQRRKNPFRIHTRVPLREGLVVACVDRETVVKCHQSSVPSSHLDVVARPNARLMLCLCFLQKKKNRANRR